MIEFEQPVFKQASRREGVSSRHILQEDWAKFGKFWFKPGRLSTVVKPSNGNNHHLTHSHPTSSSLSSFSSSSLSSSVENQSVAIENGAWSSPSSFCSRTDSAAPPGCHLLQIRRRICTRTTLVYGWGTLVLGILCVCVYVVVVVRLLTCHFSIATFKVLQEIVVNARINQKRPRIPYFQGDSENDSEQSSESQPILTDDFVDKVGPTIIDEVSCKGILLSL